MLKINDEISSTLLIPLYYKAKESKRAKEGKNAILNDPKAEFLVSNIEGKYEIYEKDRFSNIGCLFRAKYFDDKVRELCYQFSELVVINAACGLDSRYERLKDELKDKNIVFYNADLPEVIKIRKQFFSDNDKNFSLVGDVFDDTWIKDIKQKHKNANFIVILEGLLMYFKNSEIKQIIKNFSLLKDVYIYADLVGTKIANKQVKHKTMSELKIDFKSGINGLDDFISLLSDVVKVKPLNEAVYMKQYSFRYGLAGVFFGLLPQSFLRNFSSLVGVKIDN